MCPLPQEQELLAEMPLFCSSDRELTNYSIFQCVYPSEVLPFGLEPTRYIKLRPLRNNSLHLAVHVSGRLATCCLHSQGAVHAETDSPHAGVPLLPGHRPVFCRVRSGPLPSRFFHAHHTRILLYDRRWLPSAELWLDLST